MTDPNTNCPSGSNMTGYSKRTCGRASSPGLSCDSVFFPVSGGEYSQVCCRMRSYQYGTPDAFCGYKFAEQSIIESAYVSDVAVMYGSPRQHIWTFANGAVENSPLSRSSPYCSLKYYKFMVFLHWFKSHLPVAFIIGFHIVVLLCCIHFPQWMKGCYERVN